MSCSKFALRLGTSIWLSRTRQFIPFMSAIALPSATAMIDYRPSRRFQPSLPGRRNSRSGAARATILAVDSSTRRRPGNQSLASWQPPGTRDVTTLRALKKTSERIQNLNASPQAFRQSDVATSVPMSTRCENNRRRFESSQRLNRPRLTRPAGFALKRCLADSMAFSSAPRAHQKREAAEAFPETSGVKRLYCFQIPSRPDTESFRLHRGKSPLLVRELQFRHALHPFSRVHQ